MPEYPGVYVEELPGTFRSIGGVSPAIGGAFGLLSSANILLGQASSRFSGARGKPVGSSDWQYVNIRRELIFIEQSLSQGLQWAVFENNNPALWGKVSQSIENFSYAAVAIGRAAGREKGRSVFRRVQSEHDDTKRPRQRAADRACRSGADSAGGIRHFPDWRYDRAGADIV